MAYKLEGQTFNQLKVISKVGADRFGKILWMCECTCGKYVQVSTTDLTSGKRKACGQCNTYHTQEDGSMYMTLKNRHKVFFDASDYDKIKQYYWFYSGKYVRAIVDGKFVTLHRFIMDADKNVLIDHKDRNRLNNRKENLRVCTKSENRGNVPKYKSNSSGYKGVRWNVQDQRWRASITINGKSVYLGNYKDKDEAAMAYNEAAIKYFGEFALLNDIPERKSDD